MPVAWQVADAFRVTAYLDKVEVDTGGLPDGAVARHGLTPDAAEALASALLAAASTARGAGCVAASDDVGARLAGALNAAGPRRVRRGPTPAALAERVDALDEVVRHWADEVAALRDAARAAATGGVLRVGDVIDGTVAGVVEALGMMQVGAVVLDLDGDRLTRNTEGWLFKLGGPTLVHRSVAGYAPFTIVHLPEQAKGAAP